MRPVHVLAFALVALFGTVFACARAAGWPTFGHDAARRGSARGVHALSASTVSRLKRRWQIKLADVADTAPIYLSRVQAGGKTMPMLFITAKDGTTYGIDATSGKRIWTFATRGPKITTSVPVAGPNGVFLYVPGVDGYVHKLHAATGKEVRSGGFPVAITRMPDTEKNASSLNLANGFLYAATSGYLGDAPPYDGHVVAIALAGGSTHVFNSLCSKDRALPTPSSCPGERSGIWSRGGVVVDPDPSMGGRVYVATGNGPFTADHGGDDYGDSVLSLSRDGATLLGSFTPSDYAELDRDDLDLGSTAPVMLPREPHSHTPLMLVQGGKGEQLYLLNRAHLGGVGGQLQQVDLGSRLFSAPAVWQDGHDTLIIVGLADRVRAYRLVTDAHGASRLEPAWSSEAGQTPEGTSPVVSNGAVFVATDGAIVALDAATGRKLWSGNGIGDVHWQSPIVVDGWVYCADQDAHLTAYGP